MYIYIFTLVYLLLQTGISLSAIVSVTFISLYSCNISDTVIHNL